MEVEKWGIRAYSLYEHNDQDVYYIISIGLSSEEMCRFWFLLSVFMMSVLMIKSAAKAEILSSVGCMGYVFHHLFALCWTHDYH